jgi:flavin-dependent dehydrogenase
VRDVIVIGGGPAGLAAAAAVAARGLDALLLERRELPADKACGEGLLPGGVRALEALGAAGHLDPDGWSRLRAIRWIQEDGRSAEARLPAPGGMGIRRLALSAALTARAREAGAEVRDRASVESHRREADGATVLLSSGEELRARVLVAADGLGSAIREREGLSLPVAAPRRFGLRRHFALAPWADAVEVHFSPGAEAYVTPVGARRVGLAFLYEEGSAPGFDALLERFPALASRLAGAPFDSALAGAGPLGRNASARVLPRLVLAGDAGGYVDAITGEGVSLALQEAVLLGELLPEALTLGATREALLPWDRAVRARHLRHAAVTRLVLGMARRPALRRTAVTLLGRAPRLFDALVAGAVG